jgi:hypothetical protein
MKSDRNRSQEPLIDVAENRPQALNDRSEVMSPQKSGHADLEWAKQKLDEIDATLEALGGSVETLKKDARTEADRAIAWIRTARDAFKAKVDAVWPDAAATKALADDTYASLEAKWAEVELAFQEDFLAAAAGQVNVVKKALKARAEARRQSWQSSLQAIRAASADAIEHAHSEAYAALRRLAAETAKAEARLGQVSAAGDESWTAIKGGLKEAISVYERTWEKISEAVSKMR